MTYMKRTHMNHDTSENEESGKCQFEKKEIIEMTNLKRSHLKNDKSEKETPGNGQFRKGNI